MSPTSRYNVTMIATPTPAEPQLINILAILFSPNEGEITKYENYINRFHLK
jgi:hypothetical protein